MKGILICGEYTQGKISSVSNELITTGKRLGSIIDQRLDFLLIGENFGDAAEKVVRLGADRVLTVQGAEYSALNPERLVSIMVDVCERINPMVILFGQTDLGRDVAPRLAVKMGGGVCLDCVGIDFDKATQRFFLDKPVYGGNAIAQWASPDYQPLVVTMRPRSEKPAEPELSKKGTIESIPVEIVETKLKSKLLETIHQEERGIKLEDAKAIVAGGGGIGGSDGFGLVQELADVLGAAVGTTRVPSDENWMPKSLEIGQTGQMVSPNLYIAIGISGAPQHMAGCSGSKKIVAINKDPQAPIFDRADYGIVGDYREVLPALIEELKEIKE